MNYINGLAHGGIHLNNNLESLVWLFNKESGMVTASLAYELIAKSTISDCTDTSVGKIWKYNLPLKISCFGWDTLCKKGYIMYNLSPHRINTWDTLCKKGWDGPNYCCLCFSGEESVDHLFTDCRFIKDIILGLSLALHHPIYWNESIFRLN